MEGGAGLHAVPGGADGVPGSADESSSPEANGSGPPGIVPPTRRRGGSRFLADVIAELSLLPEERVRKADEEARTSGRTLEQVLSESGALSADQLARATAERFGLDLVDLTVYKPDLAAANLITPQAARRIQAVPIGFDDDTLLVAMVDPSNVLALDDLKLMTGNEVRPLVASAEDVAGVVSRMTRLDQAVAEAVEEEPEELAAVSDIRESAEDAPVIKLVNSIVAQAVEEGASDIHFEPEGRDMRVRFRVDGVLSERTTIPRRMVPGVISRVKIMADLDISERRLPQDGRVGLKIEDHAVDIRVVTMPSVHGEGITMRLLDKEQVLLELDTLGLRDDSQQLFESAFRQAYGAVLVTGPTGSGKSTTLYAALNTINAVERKIITVEDPVEYQLPGITQVQVAPRAGLTFAVGLRSMLRADPDVIMVGEIRDGETARIAMESALTGHLVLSTLHTNDAPSALTRLTEMGIEPFITASAVDCVVAQRLVRKLCRHCKRRVMLSTDALEAAGFKAAFDLEAYEPVGCARCGHTGYRGRTGLYEVMPMTDSLRGMTIERESGDALRRQAMEEGLRLVRDDGLEKVRLGVTSITEVARVT
jgi:type IV pilus assembly protein PilB